MDYPGEEEGGDRNWWELPPEQWPTLDWNIPGATTPNMSIPPSTTPTTQNWWELPREQWPTFNWNAPAATPRHTAYLPLVAGGGGPAPQPSGRNIPPWFVPIEPYEDFYFRAVNSFLDWSMENRPEWAYQYLGMQPPGAAAAGPPSQAGGYYAYGGGGGRGGGRGGGEIPTPKFTLRDILEYLQFPGQWQYPSYLRDYGRYIEELLTQNPQFAIPVPVLNEEGAILPTPEDLDELDYMETAQTYAGAWNEFLQSLINLPFFQQQSMLGVRYTPDTGWWRSGQVPMLPNPEFI